MLSRKWLVLVVLSLVIVLTLSVGCSQGEAPKPTATSTPSATQPAASQTPKPTAAALPKAITIGTLAKGSSNNIMGSGLAKVISAHTSMSVTDRPFSGMISYIPQVNAGELELMFTSSPDLVFAWNGQAPYKEKNKNLRTISGGAFNNVGFITRPDSGIKFIADAKGKRYGNDVASVSALILIGETFKANGLDPAKDLTSVPVSGFVEPVTALKENRLDICIASVGMPELSEAATKLGGIYWVPVIKSADDPALKNLQERAPYWDIVNIKAGTPGYATVNNDTWMTAIPLMLSTNKDFSEEAVYQVTKALSQNQAELTPIHPQLAKWSANMLYDKPIFPYHDGAIRFYKEAGLWSAKFDAIQAKLLAQQ